MHCDPGTKLEFAAACADLADAPTEWWENWYNETMPQAEARSSNSGNGKRSAQDQPVIGKLKDGTPCYWSESTRRYYRWNDMGFPKTVKESDIIRPARRIPAFPALRPGETGGHGSAYSQRPRGHLRDGTPYYYPGRYRRYFILELDGHYRWLKSN